MRDAADVEFAYVRHNSQDLMVYILILLLEKGIIFSLAISTLRGSIVIFHKSTCSIHQNEAREGYPEGASPPQVMYHSHLLR